MRTIFTTIAAMLVVAAFALWGVSAEPDDKRPEDRPHDTPPREHPVAEHDRGGRDRDDCDKDHADREHRGGDRHFGRFRSERFESFRPPQIPLMIALDADKDGEISAAEIENAAASLKSLDENDDGKLTREETRPQFAFRGRPDFSRRDFNANSDEHHRADRPEGRGPGDNDHHRQAWRGPGPDRGHHPDGRNPEGRNPEPRGPVRIVEHVMTLDSNDDDQLSQEEVLKLFSTADRDGDGFVSRSELEESIVEQFRDHRPPRDRPPVEGRRPPGDRDRPDHPDDPDRPDRPE